MKSKKIYLLLLSFLIVVSVIFFLYNKISAHCDTLDGPVVKACKNALETGNVNLVLIWVRKEDEAEIKSAFDRTLMVRKLSPEAKELSDFHFFETVVRLHRAGEGASFTGLKPAGMDMGPAIPAGDKAIENGSIEDVQKLLAESIKEGLQRHYKDVMEKKNYDPNDVAAGREFVRAYVEYIHYVEGIYQSAKGLVPEHVPNPEGLRHHDQN